MGGSRGGAAERAKEGGEEDGKRGNVLHFNRHINLRPGR